MTERAQREVTPRDGELRLTAIELERKIIERSHEHSRTWHVTPDLLGVLNAKGYFETANPAWQQLLGWSEEEVITTSIFDLLHPDDVERTRGGFDLLTIEGTPALRFENRYRCKDGSYRWLSWVGVPEGDKFYCSGRDITPQKEAQARLDAVEEALRQSQKMEAIGLLTGGIAHDFNNLLQVISANLHLLAKEVVGNEQVNRRVKSASTAVQRGAKLANQLLAFGRRQALEPRVVDVGRLLAGMEDMLRRSIGDAVEVEIIIGSGLWNTLIDPTAIENVVLNLAINARDAMSGTGKLTIEVGNAFLDDMEAGRDADVTPGEYVLLTVSDTGAGMSPEVVARAFEPFFTTKPAGSGSGLGLAMVFGFVKQSGGHAKIESEVGRGTKMKLFLPRSEQQADEVARPLDSGPAVGGTETILLVEDDEAVLATTAEMLGDLGYRVIKASGAASALGLIESGLSVDLLFSDVIMPGTLTSRDLARLACARLLGLRVLFGSGYARDVIVHGGRLDAGVELLPKPYTRDTLARKIRYVLANPTERLPSGTSSLLKT